MEWYDHGPHASYESANMLVFKLDQQRLLADALEMPAADRSRPRLLAALQRRFQNYFQVKPFCEEKELTFTTTVDFMP